MVLALEALIIASSSTLLHPIAVFGLIEIEITAGDFIAELVQWREIVN
jgi:hypothetical protein